MHATIIELLDLPRRAMRGELPIEDCGHAGFFQPGNAECHTCQARMECEWLFHNDEFAALSAKPLGDVLDALQAAVLFVDACVTRAGHERPHCRCELCTWLRRAQEVQEVGGGSAPAASG